MIKTLKIGNLTFKVKRVKRLLNTDDAKLNGWVQHNPCKIYYEKSLSEQMQAVTVIHEALHSMCTQAARNEEHQEQDVEIMAYGIFGLIRDNPEFVKWIQEIES